MLKTKIIKINPRNPDLKKIEEAAAIVKKGALVAFPTETVYGLAALHNDINALDKIYKVKNRPKDKPLTIHIAKIKDLDLFGCEVPHLAKVLMDKFWPGPLTVILNTKDKKRTIAFRLPDNRIAIDFINSCGMPIVAPSANISGHDTPNTAEDVLKDLGGKIEAVIDAGPTTLGQESTIIDVTSFPYHIIREGAISKIKIQDAWGSV